MGKIWDSLKDADIEYATSPYNPLSASCMSIDSYSNWDGTFQMSFVLMTGKQVHEAALEMVADVEKYRAYNIETVQGHLICIPPGRAINTQARMEIISRMTVGEVLVGMPKFIRVCLELIDRGHKLEDLFYNKPN